MIMAAIIVSLVAFGLLARSRKRLAKRRAADASAEGLRSIIPPAQSPIPRASRQPERPDNAKPTRVGTKRARWAFYNLMAARRADFWGLLDHTSIVCFVGPNGSGKSLAAVASLLPALGGQEYDCAVIDHHHHRPYQKHVDRCDVCTMGVGTAAEEGRCDHGKTLVDARRYGDRLVYSTAELLGSDGEPHPLYRPLLSFQQLVTVEHADIFFDEVAGVMDSGESDKVPVQVRNFIRKLRHFENRLLVTSPAYMNCAKSIRQVTQVVVDARSFFPERVTDGRRWRPMRGMVYRAFDAFEFEDYTSTTKTTQPLMAKSYFWRPGSIAQASYNSLGQVQSLGHVDESGLCMGCGGTRSAPRCACPPDLHIEDIDEFDVVTTLSGSTRTKKVVPRPTPEEPQQLTS